MDNVIEVLFLRWNVGGQIDDHDAVFMANFTYFIIKGIKKLFIFLIWQALASLQVPERGLDNGIRDLCKAAGLG